MIRSNSAWLLLKVVGLRMVLDSGVSMAGRSALAMSFRKTVLMVIVGLFGAAGKLVEQEAVSTAIDAVRHMENLDCG